MKIRENNENSIFPALADKQSRPAEQDFVKRKFAGLQLQMLEK